MQVADVPCETPALAFSQPGLPGTQEAGGGRASGDERRWFKFVQRASDRREREGIRRYGAEAPGAPSTASEATQVMAPPASGQLPLDPARTCGGGGRGTQPRTAPGLWQGVLQTT